jgi:hypothetical protein
MTLLEILQPSKTYDVATDHATVYKLLETHKPKMVPIPKKAHDPERFKCRYCNRYRLHRMFSVDARRVTGHDSVCKACRNAERLARKEARNVG